MFSIWIIAINYDDYSTPKDKKSSSKNIVGSLLRSLKEEKGDGGNDGDKRKKKCQGKKHSLGQLRPVSCLINIKNDRPRSVDGKLQSV